MFSAPWNDPVRKPDADANAEYVTTPSDVSQSGPHASHATKPLPLTLAWNVTASPCGITTPTLYWK